MSQILPFKGFFFVSLDIHLIGDIVHCLAHLLDNMKDAPTSPLCTIPWIDHLHVENSCDIFGTYLLAC